MGENIRLAHAVEFLTGDDAGGERIRSGIRCFATGSETNPKKKDYWDGFHGGKYGFCLCTGARQEPVAPMEYNPALDLKAI